MLGSGFVRALKARPVNKLAAFEQARESIAKGWVEKTKQLLMENQALVLEKDKEGNTLAHHVILSLGKNKLAILKALVAMGADINASNKAGQTLLHLMAGIGENEKGLFSFLMEKGANVNREDAKGLTPLHHAATQSDATLIKQLTEHRAYVDAVTREGLTPLHIAVLYGHAEVFHELLAQKADINSQAYPQFLALLRCKTKVNDLSPVWLALEMGNDFLVKLAIVHKLKTDCHEWGDFVAPFCCNRR